MSADILQFPVPEHNPSILAQEDIDNLSEVLAQQGLELHDRLNCLDQQEHSSAMMMLTIHDYQLLTSTLLMSMLAAEHRAAVLEQQIIELNDAVFGGEE